MSLHSRSRQSLLLAFAAGLLIVVFQSTSLDLVVAHLFWDAERGAFPLRGHPLLSAVLYRGAKSAMYALGVIAFLALCRAAFGAGVGAVRRAFMIAAGTLVLVPVMVTLIKHLTNRHCPWSMEPFGGEVPYVHLLQSLPSAWQGGQCFPAGHAAGGFVWVGVAIALWQVRPGIAKPLLAAGLLAGGAMGLFRMAEGAHFLSHTLWTLWLACAVPLMLDRLLPGRMPPVALRPD